MTTTQAGTPPQHPNEQLLKSLLGRIRVVLVSPSHAGNVGACARALKTMGLSQLWLVAPRKADVLTHEEAIALSSGATDVLTAARVTDSLPQALAGCSWVVATSSRERELGPPLQDAPVAVQGLLACLLQAPASGSPLADVALVFGCERTGLSNEDLLRADVHALIPANPDYASLNLSQAVQLLCWEARRACLYAGLLTRSKDPSAALSAAPSAALPVQASTRSDDPVGAAGIAPESVVSLAVDSPAVERLFDHFLKAMTAVDFLNPDKPKRLVPRLRRLLQRARLEREEVDLLHGFLADVVRISQGRWYRAEWEALADAIRSARERHGPHTGGPPEN